MIRHAGHNKHAKSQPPTQPAKPKKAKNEAPPLDSATLSHRPYFDADKDRADQAAYYNGLTPNASPTDFYLTLSKLVEETHKCRLGYDPDKYLYNWVDLRPNLRLQSIYEETGQAPLGEPVRSNDPLDFRKIEDLSRRDVKRMIYAGQTDPLKALQQQADDWAKALQQGGTDAIAIAQKIAEIETQHFFNCEHVVPKNWYADQRPMVGDLHHLFTCRPDSNSARSSKRYTEVNHAEGALPRGDGWAPLAQNAFEPAHGKGPIARATLYFLLRYPKRVGDHETEYTDKDIQTFLRWSKEDPPGLYERHRNQAIFEIQGNRNPLVDHPEWAEKIDFAKGIGHPHNWRPGK